MQLKIKRLSPNVVIPSYGSEFSAGIDVCSNGEYVVKAHTRMVIPTGLCVEWLNNIGNGDFGLLDSTNYYLRMAPRSGLSVKNSIDIGAGVIDYDYRGEIKVCFINNGENDYTIKHGDKICQMILTKIERFNEIVCVDELNETVRGDNGFGSTGK